MRYKHHKQYRLPYFNYASTGLYFVTICSCNRENIFGEILSSKIVLSTVGKYVLECLENIPKKFSYINIDEFIIMPNHIHVIFGVTNPDEDVALKEKQFQIEKRSLSLIVRNFKSIVTLLARKDFSNIKIWQPRFYDRIIRNESELQVIRKYIRDNPLQWEQDRNNPENLVM